MPRQLNHWATQIAVAGCIIVFLGGIPTWYYADGENYSIFAWVISVLLLPLMLPVKKLGPILIVVQQFYVNAIILVGLSIVCFFQVPLVIGGITWDIAALLFIIAGITGEKGETLTNLTSPPTARGE